MFSVTTYELKRLRSGEADGCTRRYPSGCPHKIHDQIPLVEEQKKGSQNPFCIAVLMSVRPGTVGERRRDTAEARRLALADGFENPAAWYEHFRMMYGASGIKEDTQVFRLQFHIKEMEKEKPARVDLNDVI